MLKCHIVGNVMHWLKCFSNNHDDEHVLETTDLPDHLVTKVGGNVLFEHECPLVSTKYAMYELVREILRHCIYEHEC